VTVFAMAALIGMPKPGSWLDVDLTDELAVAMGFFGATTRQLIEVSTQDPIAAYEDL
jgi:hypothetical protein